MEVFYSNRVEVLFEQFKTALFVGSSPFTKRIVVVPSPPLKSWLMLQLAKDPMLQVAAGIEIGYPNDTLHDLAQLVLPRPLKEVIPTSLQLALALEWEIKQALSDPNPVWIPLQNYLEVPRGATLSKKGARRLSALASKLAQLFLKYGIYGGGMLSDWEKNPSQEWQAQLWHLLFCTPHSPWTHPYRELTRPFPEKEIPNTSLHLFSLSFIPAVQTRFLSKISACLPVYSYHLSPCGVFWSDLLSQKESQRLREFWKRKGASATQQKELEHFLKDCNPLLANFGRLGREMAQQIEESGAEVDESYVQSESKTVLESVQQDLLNLRNPSEGEPLSFPEDHSIQIHGSPTVLREVQIVREKILDLVLKGVQPHEMIVMAPDIMDYEPFIKQIFPPEEGLDVQIMDVRQSTQSPLVQGFLQLIELPAGRWDALAVTTLFESPPFMRKHKLKKEDLTLFKEWIKGCGVRWGENQSHREELLQRDHCLQGDVEPSTAGTWQFGWDRLLGGLILNNDPTLSFVPYPQIDITQSELLGKWIQLFAQLRKDLIPLSKDMAYTLEEWSTILKKLLETHFDLHLEEDRADALLEQIDAFRLCVPQLPLAHFSFETIRRHLLSALSQANAIYRETQLHAVKFCSLLPMRTIPSQAIFLLGMQEGQFPRPDLPFSLNRLKGNSQVDYCPSQIDFDRYIFIEALLSARQYFILSYQTRSSEDFKEISPSLLISELLVYLDKGYRIGKMLPSEHCCFLHPLNSFDKRYFNGDSRFKSYSQQDYKAACAFYKQPKIPQHRFIPNFEETHSKVVEEDIFIDIKDLMSFVKDPLKAYFNKTLGMYLTNGEDQRLPLQDSFTLTALDFYQLRQDALKLSPETALSALDKVGSLPHGLFKHAAMHKLQKEIVEIEGNLKQLEVAWDSRHIIDFSVHTTHPEKLANGDWKLPALILHKEQQRIILSGSIQGVTERGILLLEKKSLKTAAQTWPSLLALTLLTKEHLLPFGTKLLFARDGTSLEVNATSAPQQLLDFIHYYLEGIHTGSPLLADWLEHFLKSPAEQASTRIEQVLKNPQTPLFNPYVKWHTRAQELPEIDLWHTKAEKLYAPLLAALNRDEKNDV